MKPLPSGFLAGAPPWVGIFYEGPTKLLGFRGPSYSKRTMRKMAGDFFVSAWGYSRNAFNRTHGGESFKHYG